LVGLARCGTILRLVAGSRYRSAPTSLSSTATRFESLLTKARRSLGNRTRRAWLRERDFRRKGLGIALITIVLAIGGLYLKIRQMETSSNT
jgi:hypothetical protein